MSGKRPNRKNLIQIGSVLEKMVHQYRPVHDASLLKVWDIWESAVGSAVAAHARPAAFKESILLVHVSNSTWLHHLRFMEKELLDGLNDALGAKRISSIKLKIGPL